MNEIKNAIFKLFSIRQDIRTYSEHDDSRSAGIALKEIPARKYNSLISNVVAPRTSSQDSLRAATTPTYKNSSANSSSQVRQRPAPASAPLISARMFYNAVKKGDLAAVQKCIEQKVDLSSLKPKPGTPALALALMGRNLPILHLLLPISSHGDKLEALAMATGKTSGQRNALRPGVMAVLDSVNKENKSGPAWESRQEEIDFMTRLLHP